MTQNNNISVLPFYKSIEEQDYRKSYAQGEVFTLYALSDRIIPFQIVTEYNNGLSLSVELYTKDGVLSSIDVDSYMKGRGLEILNYQDYGYSVINYPSQIPFPIKIPIGQYYLKINDGINTWYSDIITIVNDVSNCIKIQWYNINNLHFDAGMIAYQSAHYKNTLYLPVELGKPEYIFEEDTEKRDGYTFVEKQVSYKTYKFTTLATEYLCDAMRFISMADFAIVTDPLQHIYNCDTFLMTPTWQNPANLAKLECEFTTDTVVKTVGRGHTQTEIDDFNNDYNLDYNSSFMATSFAFEGGDTEIDVIPNANITSDSEVDLLYQDDTYLQISAASSFATNSTIIKYKWSIVGKPSSSNVTIDNDTAKTTSLIIPADNDNAGDYSIQLKVTDSKGNTDTTTKNITINAYVNVLPTANAGADVSSQFTYGETEKHITLDARGSRDSNGTIEGYKWSIISKPNGSTAHISSDTSNITTLLIPNTDGNYGSYTIKLEVTDNEGGKDTDTMDVSVTPYVNILPTADAGADIINQFEYGDTQKVITLDGTGSSDSDGVIVGYKWATLTKPNGSTATLSSDTASRPTLTIPNSDGNYGTYTIKLTVTDDLGGTDTDNVNVTMSSYENVLPTADAGADKIGRIDTSSTANSVINLDGSNSSDNDGSIVAYKWTILSQPTGSTVTISDDTAASTTLLVKQDSNAIGTYELQLEVTDDLGGKSADTMSVNMYGVPTADAGSDVSTFIEGEDSATMRTVRLDATNSATPNGSIVSYEWTIIDAPANYVASISNSIYPVATLNIGYNDNNIGDFTIQLKVTDSTGGTDADTMKVTIFMNKPTQVEDYNVELNDGGSRTLSIDDILDGYSDAENGTVYKIKFTGGFNQNVGIYRGGNRQTSEFEILVSDWDVEEITVKDEAANVGDTFSFPYQIADSMYQTYGETANIVVEVKDLSANNTAPTAVIIADNPTLYLNSIDITDIITCALNGSSSSDIEGDITYNWTFFSKPTNSTATISNQYSSIAFLNVPSTSANIGLYTINLEVTDSEGLTDIAKIKIFTDWDINK